MLVLGRITFFSFHGKQIEMPNIGFSFPYNEMYRKQNVCQVQLSFYYKFKLYKYI